MIYHFNEEGNFKAVERFMNFEKYELGIKTFHPKYHYENGICYWLEKETTENAGTSDSKNNSVADTVYGEFKWVNELEYTEKGMYSNNVRFENRTVLNPDFTDKVDYLRAYEDTALIQDVRIEFVYENGLRTKYFEHDLREKQTDTVNIIPLETDKYPNASLSKYEHSLFKPSTCRLVFFEYY